MRVRRSVLDAIEAHARAEAPRECCGLLVGGMDEISEAVATANVADEPRRRYEISPADHFALIRRCRDEADGPRIVGGYHSHPRSLPEPSETDLQQAFLEFVYLIAGPLDGSAPFAIRGYRLIDGRLDSVTLSVVE
jgi:desampylase